MNLQTLFTENPRSSAFVFGIAARMMAPVLWRALCSIF